MPGSFSAADPFWGCYRKGLKNGKDSMYGLKGEEKDALPQIGTQTTGQYISIEYSQDDIWKSVHCHRRLKANLLTSHFRDVDIGKGGSLLQASRSLKPKKHY
ncbi:hypothetical protein Tco_0860098 [Tanacetum coccineum]|uniref:Uncharacterized protein n=1 Tax=Tanacetum coccineum TaxID=301880 RepID=A0ABQ5BDX6_9ASTR